jgi:hypothetical protein
MGLLSKAVVKAAPEFDKMGEGLSPPPEQPSAPPEAGEKSPAGQAQRETADKIRQYFNKQPAFQGLILEFPPEKNGETTGDFTGLVSRMVSSFGSAFPLTGGNCLLLFSKNMDRELLAHRLSKSLNTRVLYQFEAGDPGMAMIQLGPYL